MTPKLRLWETGIRSYISAVCCIRRGGVGQDRSDYEHPRALGPEVDRDRRGYLRGLMCNDLVSIADRSALSGCLLPLSPGLPASQLGPVDQETVDATIRFSEEQIVGILKEQQAGLPVAQACRRRGTVTIPTASATQPSTLGARYHGGMGISDAHRLEALEEETAGTA